MRSALQALGIFFRSQADHVAAMVRKSRAWREDDAMARLEEGTLRDIGIDRCQIRQWLHSSARPMKGPQMGA